MTTGRTVRAILLVGAAMLGLVACVAVNEVATERELTCGGTPDDLCVRIADRAMSDEANLDVPIPRGTHVTVEVKPTDCSDIGRGPTGTRDPATRCWRVEGEARALSYGFGRWVYERPDGTLGLQQ